MTGLPVEAREKVAGFLLERDEALGPYDASPEGDEERRTSADAILALLAQPVLGGEFEPVAWRVKDYADGWILCQTKAYADHLSTNGNLVQPLYLASSPPADRG
jgi:hypothetical protein